MDKTSDTKEDDSMIQTNTSKKQLQVKLKEGKHEKCMKQLLDDDRLSAEKIKCILALHYFKPLSNNADYCVDRCDGYKECLECNEKINADHKEASFGNRAVWYGRADIHVHGRIVKVVTEVVLSIEDHGDELEDESGYELEDHGDELEDESFCPKILEIKIKETKKSVKPFYQAIAQTIVNAFVESGKDKFSFNKFIPSFLATEKTIRILLYNCQLDKLLVSDEFKIWQSDGRLNFETMMFVWVAMTTYVNDSIYSVQHLIANTAVSQFKEIIGEAYKFYLNYVTRPYKKVDEELMYDKTFNKPFAESIDKKDVTYIVAAAVELYSTLK